jgi:hypothetical protein
MHTLPKSLAVERPETNQALQVAGFPGHAAASLLVMICTALLVALVLEWLGMISVLEQLNFSLIDFRLLHRHAFARHRQHMTLILEAAKAHAD